MVTVTDNDPHHRAAAKRPELQGTRGRRLRVHVNIMPHLPLNFGELNNLADLYVTADHQRNFSVGESELESACDSLGCVAIFDAECELVCIAPRDKADLLERMINTYTHLPPSDD